MGNTVEQWRATIGGFCQPVKTKTRLKTINIKNSTCISLAIKVVLFMLLVVEGVESNPGPRSNTNDPSRGRGRGGRGNRGSARGTGPPRGRGSAHTDQFSSFSDVNVDDRHVGPDVRRSERLLSQPQLASQQTSNQTSLNSWLLHQSSQMDHDTVHGPDQPDMPDPLSEGTQDTESDLFTADGQELDLELESNPSTTRILLEIRKDVKQMNKKFDGLNKKVKELKLDNKQLKRQNECLSKQVTSLTSTVSGLESRIVETEKKNEQLESQSRRDNLKFYGLSEEMNESWEQSETKIRNYISSELGMDDTNIKIERAHRLPSRSRPRPIIAKFSYFKDKDLVLKTFRQKRKERLDGADRVHSTQANETNENDMENIRITEDFPQRVTKARTKLFPFLKKCHEKEQRAFLRLDTLVVDGQAYVYDETQGRPVPVK